MGLFSSVKKAFKSVTSPVTSAFKAVKPLASGLLSFGSSAMDIASPYLSYLGASNANDANSALSERQMAFQRDMSNTAYQRAVTDMKAAGINPMLAYRNGGSSTPAGQTAQMTNELSPAVNSAMAIKHMRKDLKIKDQEYKNRMEEKVRISSQTDLNAQQVAVGEQKVRTDKAQEAANIALAFKYAKDAEYSANSARVAKLNGDLLKYQVPRASKRANVHQSQVGTALSYINEIIQSLGGGAAVSNSAKTLLLK